MTVTINPLARKTLVAAVIDDYTLVINRGSKDAVKVGDRFLVYAIGQEIQDPESHESLGRLELVRGIGRVTNVQQSMATIRSEKVVYEERTINRAGGLLAMRNQLYGAPVETKRDRIEVGFDSPHVGDFVKKL